MDTTAGPATILITRFRVDLAPAEMDGQIPTGRVETVAKEGTLLMATAKAGRVARAEAPAVNSKEERVGTVARPKALSPAESVARGVGLLKARAAKGATGVRQIPAQVAKAEGVATARKAATAAKAASRRVDPTVEGAKAARVGPATTAQVARAGRVAIRLTPRAGQVAPEGSR